jgi:peptidoglycan/xylan/chitin deacetylase (PgdA/CDA1 family)
VVVASGSVQHVVSLTFDNGPTPGVTERVLDVLAAHDVGATFFVIGSKLTDAAARRAVQRALAEGHRVGGHTWSHAVPFGEAPDHVVDADLDRTAAALAEVGGDPLLFRPYGAGGVLDDRLMSRHGAVRLRGGGYTCVLWNSVPGDWVDADGWLERALDDVRAHEWTVIALHDLPIGAAGRLDEFLAHLHGLGVRFSQDSPDDCTPIRAGQPTGSYALLRVGDP